MKSHIWRSIGIAMVAMFFGYGFGLFEGRSQGYKKRKKEEAAEKKDVPVVEAPRPAPEPVKIKVDDPGLLRIKNEHGYLALDLDGARVDTTALTTDQRKRLIEMLSLMRPWLEGKPVAAPVKSPGCQQLQSAGYSNAVQHLRLNRPHLDVTTCSGQAAVTLPRRTGPLPRQAALSLRSIRSCRPVWQGHLSKNAGCS